MSLAGESDRARFVLTNRRLPPEPPEPPEPEPPPKPRRIVGERARLWARMLDEGVYVSRAALARGEGVSRAAVTQALGPARPSGTPAFAGGQKQ